MLRPNAVRLAETLARGKPLVVIVAGQQYPTPSEEISVALPEQITPADFERARVSLLEAVSKIGDAEKTMRDAAAEVAAGQRSVAESVQEVVKVMSMPTQPVYDAAGKLIGAKRVKKLGA